MGVRLVDAMDAPRRISSAGVKILSIGLGIRTRSNARRRKKRKRGWNSRPGMDVAVNA